MYPRSYPQYKIILCNTSVVKYINILPYLFHCLYLQYILAKQPNKLICGCHYFFHPQFHKPSYKWKFLLLKLQSSYHQHKKDRSSLTNHYTYRINMNIQKTKISGISYNIHINEKPNDTGKFEKHTQYKIKE